MALTIRVNSRKLDKLVDPQLQKVMQEWRRLLLQAFRIQILPAFRIVTPFRTGALIDSFQIVMTADRIGIHVKMPGEEYYKYQKRGKLHEQHEKIFSELVGPIAVETLNAAIKKVLGE